MDNETLRRQAYIRMGLFFAIVITIGYIISDINIYSSINQ